MNLKTYAKLVGIRLTTIADHCGVSNTAVSKWTRGGLPSPENFLKLLEILGISNNSVKYKKPLYFPEKLLYTKQKITMPVLEDFGLGGDIFPRELLEETEL